MATVKAVLKGGRTVDFDDNMIGDGAMKEVFFTKDRKSVVCFYKDAAAARELMGRCSWVRIPTLCPNRRWRAQWRCSPRTKWR